MAPLRLVTDYRLGGHPRNVLAEDDGFLMQVPDEVRQCAVFLHAQEKGKEVAKGTAFFLSVPFSDNPNSNHAYLVTAKHVIDGIRSRSDDGKVYMRMNVRSGGIGWAASEADDWRGHPDDTLVHDVAVLPWVPSEEQVEFRHVPISMAVSAEAIAQSEIGLGDEVFMTGLFVGHSGRRRNIPIVRVGNIAALPEEPVKTSLGLMPDVYLIEARSVGGLSGSPVFVSLGPTRFIGGGTKIGAQPIFYLLGLMHGHWDVQFEPDEAATDAYSRTEYVNMGIAIVVPVEKILEVLDQPALKKKRDEFEKAVEDADPVKPTMDAARRQDDESSDLTRGEFFDGLRKIKKEPPQPT